VVFLFPDEAFFAGDKEHIGRLKALVTEKYIDIEDKYLKAIQVKNVLHILMASNESWVVPADINSRRYCVFNVPDTHIGNHAYFEAIMTQMENGGYAAMLRDLLEYDIVRKGGGFSANKAPAEVERVFGVAPVASERAKPPSSPLPWQLASRPSPRASRNSGRGRDCCSC
jgi:hypothetical protein